MVQKKVGNTTYTFNYFVPDGQGDYKRLETLSAEEKAEFRRKNTQRMGRVFNDYFGRNPEVYAKFESQEPVPATPVS